MTADQRDPFGTLTDDLRLLGRSIQLTIDADRVADGVLRRIDDQRAGTRAGVRSRRRRVLVAAVVGVLIALMLTPPVRAAVASWFGVTVQPGPETSSEPVPEAHSSLTLPEAADLIDFAPVVPDLLGPPDGVEVSGDARVLSMSWQTDDGAVRLDEFEGVVAVEFVKRTYDVRFVTLDHETDGIWFGTPHELLPLDADGHEQVDLGRSAGPTLVWPVGDVTLRLEGLTVDEAIDVARSVLRDN